MPGDPIGVSLILNNWSLFKLASFRGRLCRSVLSCSELHQAVVGSVVCACRAEFLPSWAVEKAIWKDTVYHFELPSSSRADTLTNPTIWRGAFLIVYLALGNLQSTHRGADSQAVREVTRDT